MIKDSYLVLDDREIWTELQCRNYLKEMGLNDIVNNIDDYLDDTMNIKEQLACVDTALHGEMEDVIYNLGNQWCVPILDLTKNFIYKGVKAVYKNWNNYAITISFYNDITNECLDSKVIFYYKGQFADNNKDFITTLEDYIAEHFSFITEKADKKAFNDFKLEHYISGYIDAYLENDDELTEKNKEKYRTIQKNKHLLDKLTNQLLFNLYPIINEETQKILDNF